MEWFSRIVDLAKVPTKFVGAVALLTSLVMFSPASTLQYLSLLQFREEYGPYFGIALLVSVAILAIECVVWMYHRVLGHFLKRRRRESVRNRLENMDKAEKAVLREFFIAASRTVKLPIEQPAVSALLNADVLEQSTGLGSRTTVGSVFSLSLSDEAEKRLNPHLLDLEEFVYHTDEGQWGLNEEGQNWIMENRPSFMHELDRHLALMEGRFW
ncbi:superinfection exclusion B family protein [Salinicola acroporae]|uniref:Superinfection exclusion protein B n=1 Tax=Salinicola acroporae TaxID=1541440 RepID=A0ABT6I8S1_9GAMM|nr:superinfection exclusion B family protein [Salinicola acroporae]MDH4573882.1 hypothetical protein [Salinicola acroporae]